MTSRRGLAQAAGRWSSTHRWAAVLLWLAFVVVATVAGGMVTQQEPTPAELTNGEARHAEQILHDAGLTLPAHEVVFVHGDGARADSARFRSAVTDVVRRIEDTGKVRDVVSPLDPAGAAAVSADRHSALVQFDMAGDAVKAKEEVQPVLDAVAKADEAHPGIAVEEFGEASFTHKYEQKLNTDYTNAETISFPVTLGILLVAFGALVAALLPVVLAITVVVAAGGLLILSSHLVHIDQNGSSVMSLIGIAVGVDYSLFYIRRVREERARGNATQAAVSAAAATSGRSVIVSGLTVLVSLAGLFLSGNGIFYGMATATILVVAVAVLGSVTVLPALLSLLGHRIDKGRVPLLPRMRAERPGGGADARRGLWGAVLGGVLRRPAVSLAVCGGALAALVVPAFSLHTSDPGVSDLPAKSLPVLQTYERIQRSFPGSSAPAKVVVKAEGLGGPAGEAARRRFTEAAGSTPGLSGPVTYRVSGDGKVAVATVGLAGTGTDGASVRALRTLRTKVVPQTFGTIPGAEVAVGGTTAASVDTNANLSDRAPWVAGFVLLFTFVVMLVSFRSLVVAAFTLVLNLLSVGAAYGIVVLTFQRGWGEGLLGFTSTGGIASWVPLFLFVFLFGLSMDYHVFVVSRIREGHDRGLPTSRAIEQGIRGTASVVTGAAVVMVAVAGVFGTLPQLSMKESGVGMATAVLVDATFVRIVLLPATMKLLGDANWYLPRGLRWLPAGFAEPSAGGAAAPARSARPADRDTIATGA
ncbi:MMPL family transporter [Streptomyces sp. FXJ1.172]|uniref:MMPL family transporter n=1 Tax=Streptomyces sp. FXJ1.172 TaxID=710705 RepID=UPI0007CF38FF|nr:MMPL family transporter [Streptomyces sp. FXJ1.172]WEO94226.1 MMPL family transporter [Streptomyces sp. FXJ1.172]